MPSQFHIHGHFVFENDSALLLIFSSPLVGDQALQDPAKYITISSKEAVYQNLSQDLIIGTI